MSSRKRRTDEKFGARQIHLPFFPICEKLTVEKNFLFQIFDRNHGFQDEILPNSAAECSLCRRRIGDDGAESFNYFKHDFYFYFRKSPTVELDNWITDFRERRIFKRYWVLTDMDYNGALGATLSFLAIKKFHPLAEIFGKKNCLHLGVFCLYKI